VLAALHELDENALVEILSKPKNALIKQYQKLFDFEKVKLKFTKGAIVAIAKEALARASGARGLRSIMENITEWLIFALWIMAAGVWLPGILQVVWWRFNGWGYLTAWVFNLVFSWLVVWVLPAFGLLPHLKDYQQFWLLMLLGALVFIPVTLFTKAESMDKLVKFYVMSRPVGWWGPVRAEAERRGLL
jgi:hypothetical protein